MIRFLFSSTRIHYKNKRYFIVTFSNAAAGRNTKGVKKPNMQTRLANITNTKTGFLKSEIFIRDVIGSHIRKISFMVSETVFKLLCNKENYLKMKRI